MSYATDSLISSVKLRGMIPTGTFSNSDLLQFATEEMRSELIPLILSVREDFYTTYTDFPAQTVDPSDSSGRTLGPFAIPSRAVGAKARRVSMIDPNGNLAPIPRLQIDTLPYARWGFWIQDNHVSVFNGTGAGYPKVRLHYYYRTGDLVETTAVGTVANLDQTAKTVTLSAAPPTAFGSSGTFDLIKGTPSFDLMAFDMPATISGSVLTFSSDLPANLAAGDQVSLANQSALIQMPVEMHPVLAQAVAAKCLEAVGDEKVNTAVAKLEQMKKRAVELLTSRAEGHPKTIMPLNSPFRIWY